MAGGGDEVGGLGAIAQIGPGSLGVIVSIAGVGKTALLAQIGLAAIRAGRRVLHVGLKDRTEHVSSWYGALLDDLGAAGALGDDSVADVRARFGGLIVKTFSDTTLPPAWLEKALAPLRVQSAWAPDVILVDGHAWGGAGESPRAEIAAYKRIAASAGAALWMTATAAAPFGAELPPPVAGVADLVDRAVALEPRGDTAILRVVGGTVPAADAHLVLHADTMRVVPADQPSGPVKLPRATFQLLSGGAPGAEAEFGACAERWGLGETTFSFAGRNVERERGLVILGDEALAQADVTSAYRGPGGRQYPDTPLFRRILQSVWHQVQPAGEVFLVGELQHDGSVKGGTGWAVELARGWGKPVFVYCQERRSWFGWRAKDGDWLQDRAPVIGRARFCGTGTRFLTEDGRTAIRELFSRSFGPAPAAPL